jgi:hypothetical protein
MIFTDRKKIALLSLLACVYLLIAVATASGIFTVTFFLQQRGILSWLPLAYLLSYLFTPFVVAIPLLILHFGRVWQRARSAALLLVISTGLPLLIPIAVWIVVARSPNPSNARIALVPSGLYIMSILIPTLVMLALYGVSVHYLRKRLSLQRMAIVTYVGFVILYTVTIFAIFVAPLGRLRANSCNPDRIAVGNMALFYFTQPITKDTLRTILTSYHLAAYRIELGKSEKSPNYEVTFTYDEPRLQASDLPATGTSDLVRYPDEGSSPMAKDLIASFDRGEAVVFGVQFFGYTIGQIKPFLQEYDKRGMLGRLIDPATGARVGINVNMPLDYIKPSAPYPSFECLK